MTSRSSVLLEFSCKLVSCLHVCLPVRASNLFNACANLLLSSSLFGGVGSSAHKNFPSVVVGLAQSPSGSISNGASSTFPIGCFAFLNCGLYESLNSYCSVLKSTRSCLALCNSFGLNFAAFARSAKRHDGSIRFISSSLGSFPMAKLISTSSLSISSNRALKWGARGEANASALLNFCLRTNVGGTSPRA